MDAQLKRKLASHLTGSASFFRPKQHAGLVQLHLNEKEGNQSVFVRLVCVHVRLISESAGYLPRNSGQTEA